MDFTGENITDGPTLLKVVVDTINPSMRVGIGNLMEEIESVTMLKFSENVNELLDFMQNTYNRTVDEG